MIKKAIETLVAKAASAKSSGDAAGFAQAALLVAQAAATAATVQRMGT